MKKNTLKIIETGYNSEMLSQIELSSIAGGLCSGQSCGSQTNTPGGCGVQICGADACGINACIGNACGGNICGIQLCPADFCLADGCLVDLFVNQPNPIHPFNPPIALPK